MTELERQELERQILEQIRMKQLAYKRAWNAALTEHIVLNAERNVALTAYLLDVGGECGSIPRRPAVLALPGGGYAMCSERQAAPRPGKSSRRLWPQPKRGWRRNMAIGWTP